MKVIFLDRDGVINEFPGNGKYVTKCKDFHFIPGSLEAIKLLTAKGYTLFVVSNQAGVGKGIFTKKKLDQITSKMLKGIKQSGGRIKNVYYSIRRSDEGCQFRKPNIGSVEKAMMSLNKSLRFAKFTYFIGDTESDIQAGQNAGCKTVFVLSGREDRLYMRRWDDIRPNYICNDLLDAAKHVILNGNSRVSHLKKYKKPKRKRSQKLKDRRKS